MRLHGQDTIGACLRIYILGIFLNELGSDEAVCHKVVVSRRRVADVIRSLVKARYLQLDLLRSITRLAVHEVPYYNLSVLGSCMSHCSCLF